MAGDFLQLSHVYQPGKNFAGGWYASEKLDGIRACWDGGITKGMLAAEVPWANTEKDNRLKEEVYATGLWSRYGKVIRCPEGFTDTFPDIPVDGELYLGPGRFQELTSIVKSFKGTNWSQVKYVLFDAPPPKILFADREIKNTNYKKRFSGVYEWFRRNGGNDRIGPGVVFRQACVLLKRIPEATNLIIHPQIELPTLATAVQGAIDNYLEAVLEHQGEGLILRNPHSVYSPSRTHNSLKVKPANDAEGMVIGYTFGRETDLGSKLLGKLGALIVQFGSVTFELSGFTDAERRLLLVGGTETEAIELGKKYPGERCPVSVYAPHFPLGSIVTFHFRELTNEGRPKEARYWRKREE